jgi:hypothetical protein
MSAPKPLTFTAKLWLYPGPSGWYFVTVPLAVGKTLNDGAPRKAWGSIRVTARIGRSAWKTSVFPDAKSQSYLLPVKAEVRKKEGVGAGDRLTVTLRRAA